MESLADFKRMVLGLPHSTKDYASVRFTAELADLLGLDLIGVFAEDERLMDLAVLPCVREFQLGREGWHRLDAEQLERCSSQAVANARRLFSEAAKARQIGTRFDLVKGPISQVISSQSMPDDIIAIIEPRNPAERVTHQFKQLMSAALNASAATLLIPSRISHRKGPIVAVGTSGYDPSIQVGLEIAKSAHEKLLVLAPAGGEEPLSCRFPAASVVSVDRRSIPSGPIGLPELGSLLALTSERLVVLSRQVDAELPSKLAFERGVPVLVPGKG